MSGAASLDWRRQGEGKLRAGALVGEAVRRSLVQGRANVSRWALCAQMAFIRLGTAGALQPQARLGQAIVAFPGSVFIRSVRQRALGAWALLLTWPATLQSRLLVTLYWEGHGPCGGSAGGWKLGRHDQEHTAERLEWGSLLSC